MIWKNPVTDNGYILLDYTIIWPEQNAGSREMAII